MADMQKIMSRKSSQNSCRLQTIQSKAQWPTEGHKPKMTQMGKKIPTFVKDKLGTGNLYVSQLCKRVNPETTYARLKPARKTAERASGISEIFFFGFFTHSFKEA